MCGILGFNFEDSSFLNHGLEKIKHRGPDSTGKYSDNLVSLGHKRLSIIDLSKSGKQPMSNEDGTIWIVFNGEIYNYLEIKKNLKNRHNFSSNTDTEVLIHLYEEEGFSMLDKLNGMFAFCIYDSRKKILFIARDRAGEKPLYYYSKNGKFVFCSELKGILEKESISREVNREAIPYFLAFRANTKNETLFKDIMKLPPAHFMVYNLKSKKFNIKRYWDIFRDIEKNDKDKSERYYSDKLRNLFLDSVKSKMISDVPFGAYLSGGVDSGAVVSAMSRFSSLPIKTFSVGFEEEKVRETDEAKFLADKFGTDHHELLIDRKAVKNLPSVVYHADEPMSDPTSIPVYLLSQYAKKFCTVILTGEGADEVFAGYPQYKFMKMHDLLVKKTPGLFRSSIVNAVKLTPSSFLNKGFKFSSSLGEKGLERFSNFIKADKPEVQYLNQVSIFNEEENSEILNRKVNLYSKYSAFFKNKHDLIKNCQILDFKGNMVDDLLMKLDKNTMAFSIEGRVPFLDHRIVNLSFSMPAQLRLKGITRDKHILRKMLSSNNLLPKETIRRKKRHFFVPIDEWLKSELSDVKSELLSKEYLHKQKIFNASYIDKINKNLDKSKLFYSRQLWSLLTFQIWYKQFIEDEKVKI